MPEFIEHRGDGYFVTGTRVSLASVVHHFRLGASPETILQKFPALGTLGQVYGAIAAYLNDQTKIDAYLADLDRKWKDFETKADPAPASLSGTVGPARPRL